MNKGQLEVSLEEYKKTKASILLSVGKVLSQSNTIDEPLYPGDIFSFGELKGLIIDDGRNFYWCCKISELIEFASPYDVIVNFKGKKLMVETSNVFIVPQSIMNKASKVGTINDTDFNYVLKAYDGNEIPSHKTGAEFVSKDDLRFIFHKEEQSIVREFSKILAKSTFDSFQESQKDVREVKTDCITISYVPEDIFELAAADIAREVESTDDFILSREESGILLIPSSKFIGKRGVITIFDKELFYEYIPRKIFINLEDSRLLSVPLSAIAKNIEIEKGE